MQTDGWRRLLSVFHICEVCNWGAPYVQYVILQWMQDFHTGFLVVNEACTFVVSEMHSYG